MGSCSSMRLYRHYSGYLCLIQDIVDYNIGPEPIPMVIYFSEKHHKSKALPLNLFENEEVPTNAYNPTKQVKVFEPIDISNLTSSISTEDLVTELLRRGDTRYSYDEEFNKSVFLITYKVGHLEDEDTFVTRHYCDANLDKALVKLEEARSFRKDSVLMKEVSILEDF